nr:hypothetical protein [Tanacetum cinerariifolium]
MEGDDNNGDHPETSNTSPPVPPPTQQIPHTVSSIKLPILKKGEYDIWAMKMEHYLSHTDYLIWQVIHNENGHVSVTTDTNEMIKVLPPKTAKEVVMADAKEIWEAIKSRFGGNDESKKMHKYLLKQQFEGFSVSASEGVHKGYDSIMDATPSPNHAFNFPEVEFEEDPQEEPEEEFEEDPEEDPEKDPEEELEAEVEDDVPPPATPPVGSPITPPLLFESSSDTKDAAPIVANEALEMPPIGSTYEVGGPSFVTPFPLFYLYGREIARLDDNTELLLSNIQYLERCEKKCKTDMEASISEIHEVKKCIDKMDQDFGDEMQFNNLVEHRVTELENREHEKAEEMDKMKKRLGTLEANYSLVLSDRDEWKKAFFNLQAWVSKRLGRGALDVRPDIGDDGPVSFGESKPPKQPGSPSSSQIMPPKMMKRKAVNKMVKKQIAEAIEEYERTKVNPGNASGSGETNTGGQVNVQGYTHKTFMNGKPHPFNGTKGVVGLRRWIKKGRALTWWNGNVHTLGLVNANRIPWTEFKSMMTTEYCPATEIQRMEEELWTLTLKEDDIEAYNNHFHEWLLCVPIWCQMKRRRLRVNLARELVEQAVQRKAHHQQNKRQETARAYATAPAKGKAYARTLPKCNRCNLHHTGRCPPKCRRCQRLGHHEADCKVRLPCTEDNPLRNVTCYGCGEKGHLRHLCPKGRNQQNEGARARAYVVVETHSRIRMCSRIVSTNTVLRGCTLALFSHTFKIDLLPTRLGSFDVIVGMDWLSYHRAVIVFYEKIVRIPLPNGEILEIHGDRPEKDPKSLSCIKADEVRLNDKRTVCDFPEVYPDDLTGLPPITKPLTQLTQKNEAYVWGDKQEESFCILKEKICNAPVLALPDGPNDFVRRWIELLSDYECEIKYHPGKANVVVDALSRKERLKPRRVRAMSMTIQSGLKAKILEAQGEASKDLKAPTEWLRGLERHFEKRDDVHPGADKMYYDLRDLYWWPGMKRDIPDSGHDAIWVVVDRLTKSAHFLPIRKDYKTKKLARIYINKIVARHESIISDRDGRFASHLWQALQKALGTKLNISTAYHPETDGQRSFEIVERVGRVAYRLKLPQKLSCIHDTFHVSNLKKCLAESDAQIPLEEIKVDESLRFVKEAIEIVERDVKKLKRQRIPLVKVRWNSPQGAEYTWEREDQFKTKYPHLFASTSSIVAS